MHQLRYILNEVFVFCVGFVVKILSLLVLMRRVELMIFVESFAEKNTA